jgi:isoaspartyl peptidase/L-asparaginase-like protein (Ntn-hydrolase superfamily)
MYIARREDVPLGIIAINSKGETGVVYNTRGMAYCHFNSLGRVFPPPAR